MKIKVLRKKFNVIGVTSRLVKRTDLYGTWKDVHDIECKRNQIAKQYL